MTTRTSFRLLTALALLAGPAACTVSTEGTAPSPSNPGATGSGGDANATTSSGVGGQGGGDTTCTPGSTLACYSGPAGTEGKGICKGGVETCDADGAGFGACEGEVVPAVEDCSNQIDDDCNGMVDDGCPCTPGEVEACYSGAAGTEGVGLCIGGTHTCNADGASWSACAGEIVPAAEDCATAADEDCDGKAFDDADSGCVCAPGTVEACDTGLLGVCSAGTKTCDPTGTSYAACAQAVQASFDDCVTAADEDCDGAVVACSGTVLGTKRFGAASDDVVYAVARDAQGNVFVGGAVDGTVNAGGYGVTSTSGALTKYDAQGTTLWSHVFVHGAGSVVVVRGVAVDPTGNVFAFGSYSGSVDWGGISTNATGGTDVFVVKFDTSGALLWAKGFGDPQTQTASSATCDDQGNVIVVGTFDGQIDFGGGSLTSSGDDAFVAKLSGTGTQLWSKRYGDWQNQRAWGVAAGPNDTTIVVGETAGVVDFGGGPLSSVGSTDVFLTKLGANGAHVWSHIYGDASTQAGYAVALDPQQNVVVTGFAAGVVDFGCGPLADAGNGDAFVARIDPSGTCLWSKRYGDGNPQTGRAVATDPAGNPIVVGSFAGTVDFGGGARTSKGGFDVFVAKLQAATGDHVWSYGFGDAMPANNDQYGWASAIDAQGNAWIGGDFSGTLALPGSTSTSAGGFDGFVAKLSP
jgi:hypothetical protein